MKTKFPKLKIAGISIEDRTITIKKSSENPTTYQISEIESLSLVKTENKDYRAIDLLTIWFNRFWSPSNDYPATIYYISTKFKTGKLINVIAINFDLFGIKKEIAIFNELLKEHENS